MLFYRIIFSLALPFLLWRGRDAWRARLFGPALADARLWLHGASVGELTAAKPVIAALSDQPMLVTCNTRTGLKTVENWGFAHVQAALAPLDRARTARRMMRKVRALIVMENEFWPNRLMAAHSAGVPVIMLSARMSASSAGQWGQVPQFARALLQPVTLVVPQDGDSGQRLIGLGLPKDALTAPVQLKAAYVPTTRQGHPACDPAKTILAASTHDGEDGPVLRAFAQALRHDPALRLTLAPRHPERTDDIATLIAAEGLTMSRQSTGEDPTAQVHLADTLGMMDTWYASAGVCFIGGSLQDHGGHTPFEPLAHDLPILHGPHVANFAEVYAALDAADGARCARDENTLAAGFIACLGDQEMPKRARAAVNMPDIDVLTARIRDCITTGPPAS